MARAQGSLEYLIILAVVLTVSGVVVAYMTGIIGAHKSSVTITDCKQAAIDCKASRLLSSNDPCLACDTACKDSTGAEVFDGATYCCTNSQPEMIFGNSSGCGGGFTYKCNDGTALLQCSTSPLYGGKYCNHGVFEPGCSSHGCDCLDARFTCTPATDLCTGELFYDEFTNLNSWTGDITLNIYWFVATPSYMGNLPSLFNQSNSAYEHSYGQKYIYHSKNTVGYKNIQVSFWAYPHLTDALPVPGENMTVDWSADGTNWNNLYAKQTSNAWEYSSYSLPAAADNNPNFQVRVGCYDWHQAGWEWCAVDTFRIIGSKI